MARVEVLGAPRGDTMHTTNKIDRATVFELAAKANVDPRTIEKVARGETVRGMSGDRAVRALREAGLLPQTRDRGRAA